jgi:hypothetical protein
MPYRQPDAASATEVGLMRVFVHEWELVKGPLVPKLLMIACPLAQC